MNWEKYLPFLIILLCPLMHFLMMRGHHKKDQSEKNNNHKNCH